MRKKQNPAATAMTADLAGLSDPLPGGATMNTETLEAFDAAPVSTMVPPEPAPAETIAPKVEPKAKSKATPNPAGLPPHFEVVVAGEYYASDPDSKHKTRKPYEETFRVEKYEGLLGVIVTHLLKPRLAKQHPDFRGVRTHSVVSVTPKNGMKAPARMDIKLMSHAELLAFIAREEAPIDTTLYADNTPLLKDAVVDYLLNPVGFERREAVRSEKLRSASALARLNS